MRIKKSHLFKLFLSSFLVAVSFASYNLFEPELTRSANLTAASVTLGNSRISYRAGVASGTSGTNTVTIDAASNPDIDTDHLFPQDDVCFSQSTPIGCRENTTYNVNDIIGATSFHTTAALGSTLAATDLVIATQSGSWTIAFTTVTEVPNNGDIQITIPMTDNVDGNDGFPDAPASIATGGFDLNSIAAGDIAVGGGCTPANWGTPSISEGSGTTDHTITINRTTGTCAAGSSITVTIDSAPGIVNPGPYTTANTQGVSDSYQINIETQDASDVTLDEVDVVAAPIEAVLISATVDETLTFTVTAQSADAGSRCGITRTSATPDTTATSVPWGTLLLTYTGNEEEHNTNQLLAIDTNASDGYSVTVIATNQMAKGGTAACTGDAGASVDCIPDTACGGTPCTHTTAQDWDAGGVDTYPGLGYSLEEITSGAASFEYDDSGTFYAKQFADQEDSQAAQTIMTEAGPVENSQVYICFRIDVTALQPAGYYQNYIRYTATGTF